MSNPRNQTIQSFWIPVGFLFLTLCRACGVLNSQPVLQRCKFCLQFNLLFATHYSFPGGDNGSFVCISPFLIFWAYYLRLLPAGGFFFDLRFFSRAVTFSRSFLISLIRITLSFMLFWLSCLWISLSISTRFLRETRELSRNFFCWSYSFLISGLMSPFFASWF